MHPPQKRSSTRKGFRRAGITSGFLVIAIPLATLRDFDPTPWHQSEAASSALRSAADMHRDLAAAPSSPLEAGWAKHPLPTAVGFPLAGYGARGNGVATALGEPLFARALCLRTGGAEVIFLTADLLLIPPGVAASVITQCAASGVSDSSIYFTATHTHCGPGGWSPGFIEQFVAGDFNPDTTQSIAAALTSAVLASRTHTSPAQWDWLETTAHAHVRNRTLPGGITDPTLSALAVRKTDNPHLGTAIFAFYGAHATCFGPGHLAFSADYPGHLIRDLESGGTVSFAAFAAGPVGSQAPSGSGSGSARAQEIGSNLARLLNAELATASWKPNAALATARRTLPTLPIQIRVNPSTRLAPWLADPVHPPSAPFHLVRLDQHFFTGVAAEFSAMLSSPLRAEAKAAGVGLTITPFNGDYIGYVIPDDLYNSGSYEAQMNFQGPGGGSFFSALIRSAAGLPPASPPEKTKTLTNTQTVPTPKAASSGSPPRANSPSPESSRISPPS